MEQKQYLISDAAKQVEVENHVLRYWEEELELPIKRNKLGHRYYTTEDVKRLKRVKAMKEEGFQLKAIRRALKSEILAQNEGENQTPGEAKAGETKAGEAKAGDAKAGETKAGDAKAEETKAGEAKAGDAKAGEIKTKEAATEEIQPTGLSTARDGGCIVEKRAPQENEDKSYRLQMLLKNMMVAAVREGNEEFCEQIKDSVLKELDYQFRMREEREEERESERIKREEEHYKQIDEMLREKAGKKEKKEKRKKHSFF